MVFFLSLLPDKNLNLMPDKNFLMALLLFFFIFFTKETISMNAATLMAKLCISLDPYL